jgi:hypothetical protein
MRLEIIYKPENRIGNGMIAANSKKTVEILGQKEETFKKYGDQKIAEIWAKQILKHSFPNTPCKLINVIIG